MNKKERKEYNKQNKKVIKKIYKEHTPEEIADSFVLPRKILSKKKEKKLAKEVGETITYVRILNKVMVIHDNLFIMDTKLDNIFNQLNH